MNKYVRVGIYLLVFLVGVALAGWGGAASILGYGLAGFSVGALIAILKI